MAQESAENKPRPPEPPPIAGAASPSATCRRCGGRLTAAGPGGVCPRCLMACALEEPPPPDEGEADPDAPRLPPRFGRYTLLRLIGRGAMGDVYLAHDAQTERRVAIKTPQLGRSANLTNIARFRREAQLAAALSHPNICPVYDVGEVDGVLYYTMAYIAGRPLTDWIEAPQALPLSTIVELVLKLASAMGHAHRQGIVHRDLKPANIMIDRRHEPIIMDFGLARHAAYDSRLTQSNTVVGTPAYLAPELLSGNEDSPASDVYALGVVLYELLTKRLPFAGHLGEMLAQITRDIPPPPSAARLDVPPALDAICRRALAKKPTDRYESMAAMATALSNYLRWPDQAEATPSPWQRIAGALSQSTWSTRAAVIAVSTLTLVTLTVGWSAWRRPRDTGTSADPAEKTSFAERRSTERSATKADSSQAASTPATSGAKVDADASASPQSLEPADATPSPATTENAAERAQDKGTVPPTTAASTPPSIKPLRVEAPSSSRAVDAEALPSPEAPRLAATLNDKPRDPPQPLANFTTRRLAEMRQLGAERQRLLKALADSNQRVNHELASARTQLAGDLASVQRLGESTTRDWQALDTQIATLTQQRRNAEAGQRVVIDNELAKMQQNRVAVMKRIQGLEIEARGKVVELARVEKDLVDGRKMAEQQLLESQRLFDTVFWQLDPSGSFGSEAYQEFAHILTEWLDFNPDQVELLAMRSIAWTNAGQLESAAKDAARALALQPKSSLAITAQAYLRLTRGQSVEALADLNRALRMTPQSPYVYFFRGLAYRARKNDLAAAEDFSRATHFAAHVPWTHAQWALQLAATPGDRPAVSVTLALEQAERACALTQHQAWFCLDVLACAQATAGQFEAAVGSAQAALDGAPQNAQKACREKLELFRARQRSTFTR